MAFLNPIFLLGAIAAGIPILVHLVRRTRARREPFPSLMFLKRIEQKTIRRRTIRNLLLLALRCLALLLLAFAFARPYFPALSSEGNERDSSSVILVDASYSMRYRDVFNRAKNAALNIVREAPSTEKIAVVSFGQSFKVEAPLETDHQPAIATLNQMQAGLESTDYEQAIAAADSLLKDSHSASKRIHLISDFQATGWDRSRASAKLAPGVRLFPVDVGESDSANLAIATVKSDPVIYAQKYSGKLSAQIANYSLEAAEIPVELRLNDLAVERRQIPVNAQSSETIEFSGFNVPAGSNRATLDITGDEFALDNRYNFSIRREDQQRVLVVETPSRGRSESLFVQQALSAGENNEHALTIKSPGTLNPAEVETYQAVILNDAAGVSDVLASALKSFVERGGGLIMFAAKHTDETQFNKLFSGVAPARLGETVQSRGYSLMSQIKTDHPLFAAFARSGRLASPRVYARRACTPNDGTTTVASLDDGSPVIVEGAAGKGRVVLLTTTADTAWNDLPLTPVFLPLMRQMLAYTSGRDETSDYLIGQAFRAAADDDGSHPAVEAPGGGRVEDSDSENTEDQIVQAAELGFYRLRYRDRTEFVAVNLNSKESDFGRLSVDDFIASFAPDDARTRSEPAASERTTAEQIEAKQRVWLPLILAALAMFVVEALLARRIRLPRLVHE
jgi:hypothetical protein